MGGNKKGKKKKKNKNKNNKPTTSTNKDEATPSSSTTTTTPTTTIAAPTTTTTAPTTPTKPTVAETASIKLMQGTNDGDSVYHGTIPLVYLPVPNSSEKFTEQEILVFLEGYKPSPLRTISEEERESYVAYSKIFDDESKRQQLVCIVLEWID